MEQQQAQQQQGQEMTQEQFLSMQRATSLSKQVSQQALTIAELESQLALANNVIAQDRKRIEDLEKELAGYQAAADKLPGENILEGEAEEAH